MIDLNFRWEMLQSSLTARVREITEYQVNIDNFRLALEACEDEPDMAQFREQLSELLRTSTIEQRKAKIMHDVIAKQLEAGYVG